MRLQRALQATMNVTIQGIALVFKALGEKLF